jgi:glycosyltransferase involved in cell wall biosynthesis
MKKLIFLTGEDMLDVDLPIVKEINANNNKDFELIWVVVLRGYGWFKKDEMQAFCRQNQIDCVILEQLGKLKNPKTILFTFKLLKILKKLNADIIYDSYLGVPYMHFLRPLYLKKDLFVIAIHDVVQHHKMKDKMVRTFYYTFLMKTYLNFHIFSENQLRIFKEKFKGKNSFCTPLYLKNFGAGVESKLSQNKDNTVFLFFGIIRPNKGLDILIDAANSLGGEYRNFHVVVAGKCDNWEEYQNTIRYPEQFTLHIGNVEKEKVPGFFTNAHFLVLPYRDVTQSGVLLTAYNYNIPVIATELEWFEEYVEDTVNGYLFENDNTQDLAKQMVAAIKLSQPEYSQMVGKLKGFISKEINITDIAQEYVKFFKSINNHE